MADVPYLRRTGGIWNASADVLVALVPLVIFSCSYFGWRPLLLVLTGMAVAFLTEAVCLLIMRRPLSTVLDGTALVTGALVGCMLSPAVPFWMPIVAAAFAIVVVKSAFGGLGGNLFNPAAAGIALLTYGWKSIFFVYPSLTQAAPLLGNTAVIPESSLAGQLAVGATPTVSWSNLLFGAFPGPVGGTAMLILLTCFVYLWIRRSASPLVTFPYLMICAILAGVFPRGEMSWYYSILTELSSGYLLFAGVFLLNDPVLRPTGRLARVFYGLAAGILVMLLRHFGGFEEGACFAVMLVNALSPLFEKYGAQIERSVRDRRDRRKARAAV